MPSQTFYATGTVSVNNGATAVTGAGTGWADDVVMAGDLFMDPAQPAIPPQRIASVTDGTHLVLAQPWPGTSMTAAAYEVRFVGYTERSTAQTRRYLAMLGQLAALGIQPDAFGLYADRNTYDDQAKGYIYLSLDGDAGATTTAWTLYIKLSATSADWDAGQPIEGAAGPQGDPGQNVVWLAAAGAPAGGTGANGDMYLNITNWDVYGPKAAGAWGSSIGNIKGAQGNPGNDGANGLDGADGADGTDPGVLLTWDDVNTDADPGAGNIRADNDALGSATTLYVSKTNRAGDNIAAFLAGLDDSTNTNKGQVTLTRSGGNAQAGFDVTGITDATGYVKVAVSGHWGVSGFLDGNAISFQFSRSGDKGADGLGAGDVVGPAGAVNNRVATFDGTTGKVIKDSGVVLGTVSSLDVDTDTALAANSDVKVASQKATKAYVDQIIAAQDAMVFKGVIDCSTNPNYPAADRGHTYRVSVAGKIGGASGTNVEAGDILLCLTDGTASGNQATVGTAWTVVQANLDGAVIGPASVTDGNPAVFDGVTGKLIKQITFSAFKTALALAKGDVGLGNVDNTSNATERAATATLTNKRITPRVTTITSSATPTVNTDSYDAVDITALAAAITSMTTNLSGTPTNFQKLLYRIKDNGTACAIAWGASFEARGAALPTTTVVGKVLTVGFIYDTTTSKWGCVASAQEA